MPATMAPALRSHIPPPAEDTLDFLRRWAGEPEAAAGRAAFDRVASVLERDRTRHLLAAATLDDLDRLEHAVGLPLPPQYRQLLTRLGGGILYDRHELFGPRRLMIHDIELVPDVLSVRARRAHAGLDGSPFFLPLHRSGADLHWLDLRDGSVRDLSGSRRYCDLAAFLEDVVVRGPRIEPS